MNALLQIDKPSGMTSFGVVARVRRVLSQAAGKKVKVGHTGTLDPFATGLMLIVTGQECKNASHYTKLDKVYEATIVLGQTSSTGDPEGELRTVATRDINTITVDEIRQVVQRFVGEIQQTPPAFSAIKINGQRAYALARKGETVAMPTRTITVYSLEMLSYEAPLLRVRAHVSSGTYIRTLAEDIGAVLGTGAYCLELRRTAISTWSVANAEALSSWLEREQREQDRTHHDHESH